MSDMFASTSHTSLEVYDCARLDIELYLLLRILNVVEVHLHGQLPRGGVF